MGNKNIWTLEEVSKLREYLSSASLRADHLSDTVDIGLLFDDIEAAKRELHELYRIAENRRAFDEPN